MYYAYVLKSEVCDFYYKGHCQSLKDRLNQHNSGRTKSIKPFLPFKLIYFEEFETLNEAIKREKYFKTSAGRRYLKSRIKL